MKRFVFCIFLLFIGIFLSSRASPVYAVPFNNVLSFDGEVGYVKFLNSPTNATDNFTVTAWIKPHALITNNNNIIGSPPVGPVGMIYYNGNDYGGWGLAVQDDGTGKLRLVGLYGGVVTVKLLNPGIPLQNDVWQHVALVRRGGDSYLYLNGKQSDTQYYTSPNVPMNNLSTVGAEMNSADFPRRFYSGLIDEVKIFNTGYSQEQIQTDYDNGRSGIAGDPSLTNLVGGWHFDDTGPFVSDYSPSGDTGRLTYAPWGYIVPQLVPGTSNVLTGSDFTTNTLLYVLNMNNVDSSFPGQTFLNPSSRIISYTGSSGREVDGLVKFDSSSLPSGAIINNLILYMVPQPLSGGPKVSIFGCPSYDEKTVTWNSFLSGLQLGCTNVGTFDFSTSSDRDINTTTVYPSWYIAPADHTADLFLSLPTYPTAVSIRAVYYMGTPTPTPNQPPVVNAIQSATINEGDTYSSSGSFTDPDSMGWNATVDYGDGSGTQPLTLSGTNFNLTHVYKDEGTYTVTVTVTDNQGATGTGTGAVTVHDVPPTVHTISTTATSVQVGNAVTASSTFSDPGVLDTHTASWNWGDGNTTAGTVTETNGSGSVSDTHTYTSAGVYTITLTVTDDDGMSAVSPPFQYVVVYDPSGGFLTSSGSYNSTAGWDKQNAQAAGDVKFGIDAKYNGGHLTIPIGQSKFTFKTGNIDFSSTSFQWLVVSGAEATVEGTGTINGSGGYTFLFSGIDGSQTGGQSLMRILITDSSNTTIYDTQPRDPSTAAPITPLTNGVIKVH